MNEMPANVNMRRAVQPPGAGPLRLVVRDHRHVAVADGDALGQAGRARRVHDVGEVVAGRRRPGSRSSSGSSDVVAATSPSPRRRVVHEQPERRHCVAHLDRGRQQRVAGEHRRAPRRGRGSPPAPGPTRRVLVGTATAPALCDGRVGHDPAEHLVARAGRSTPGRRGRRPASTRPRASRFDSLVPFPEGERGPGVEVAVRGLVAVPARHEAQLVD